MCVNLEAHVEIFWLTFCNKNIGYYLQLIYFFLPIIIEANNLETIGVVTITPHIYTYAIIALFF
ncbi:hypothetical protein ACJX0J_038265, partial [Zea mays]